MWLVVLALHIFSPSPAGAGCLVANPSFEILGQDEASFAGWEAFGRTGVSTSASHGARSARVSSPESGPWGVSAVWQSLDAAPGDVWSASVVVSHGPERPLTGDSRALVNIEWRDASGDLIAYESFTAADASTAPGDTARCRVESPPAPPGTRFVHLLLGVIQAPGDPLADVILDDVRFEPLTPTTPDERQWLDFPGGRQVAFAGRSWRVKGPGIYGPGPNVFCDAPECVWVDGDDRLHLTIGEANGTWFSTEVALEEALEYGDYVFTTRGRLDAWHPNVVLGLFLWQYAPCYDPADAWWNPYDEIDIEFSRWGSASSDIGQFVVQPYDAPGNLERFDAAFDDGELTSHAFRWLPDRVVFRSWRGGPNDEDASPPIHAWTYTGPHLPRPDQPRAHINLWIVGTPPDGPQEIVLEDFRFTPADPATVATGPASEQSSPSPVSWAVPNPFTGETSIRMHLLRESRLALDVFDVTGRHVRRLASGTERSGLVSLAWDGNDASGDLVAPGVYFYRLRAGAHVETRRLLKLR